MKRRRAPDIPARDRRDLHRIETALGKTLRAGVLTSVALLALGVTVSLLRHPDYLSDPQTLSRLIAPGAAFSHTLPELWDGRCAGQGRALMSLGLLVLIATPVLRVAMSAIAFMVARDTYLAVIATLVLLILLGSLATDLG